MQKDRSEYFKEYGRKNREKIAARAKQHRLDNPELYRARWAKYYRENREAILARQRERQRKSKEKEGNMPLKGGVIEANSP